MLATMVSRLKKTLSKTPKIVPKKRNLNQNINDILYLEFFFLLSLLLFRAYNLSLEALSFKETEKDDNSSTRSSGNHQSFFDIRFLAEILKARKS